MKPYPKYKPSGVEWLGEIPNQWNVVPLKYITNFINGAAFKPTEWKSEGIPIIRIENLNGGTDFNFSDGNNIDSRYKVTKGDLLFGWSGNRGTSFGPFIWSKDGEYFLNQHIFKIQDFAFDKNYFYWLLKDVTVFVEKQAHGIIGMVHITKGDLGSIKVPNIPLPEQQAIASFLDDKTKQIDTLIEKKQKLIELLKEERQAVINEAVTKGINPKAKMKPSGVEWLGNIPEHWEVRKMKYLVQLRNDKREFDESVLRVENENIESWTGKYLETSTVFAEREELKSFNAGDVLFNKLRPYLAKVFHAVSEGFSGGELLILRPSKSIESKFLYYRLLSDAFIKIINSSTEGAKMPRADWDFISQIQTPFPAIEEQRSIAAFLDEKVLQINNICERARKEIELLQEYRTALITEVVTGKVCITNFD